MEKDEVSLKRVPAASAKLAPSPPPALGCSIGEKPSGDLQGPSAWDQGSQAGIEGVKAVTR